MGSMFGPPRIVDGSPCPACEKPLDGVYCRFCLAMATDIRRCRKCLGKSKLKWNCDRCDDLKIDPEPKGYIGYRARMGFPPRWKLSQQYRRKRDGISSYR